MDEEERILEKYSKRLERNISKDAQDYQPSRGYSREYLTFRKEALGGNASTYEKFALAFGKIISIKPNKKDYQRLKTAIDKSHLAIKPEDAASFATLSVLLFIVLNIIVSGYLFFFMPGFDTMYLLFPVALVLISLLMIKHLTNIPVYIANKWQLKASNQMVLCVLYIVMYMRHTSNLEHGIKFASEHVGNPLALDLRKIFWDVEVGKYSTLKESLDNYLAGWREHNLEFVEAFHLIEGSLYESGEDRRVAVLEKALDVMLNGTYEKMLHYAQDLKNPITMIHMLGVILPILGLVILPLVGSLMGGLGITKIIILFLLYDIVLPLAVYFFGMNILSKRPTGYNETNILESNPALKKYENILIRIGKFEFGINPFWLCLLIFVFVAMFAFIPLMMYGAGDFKFLGTNFMDYKSSGGLACEAGDCYGPFGAGAVLLSLFFPLALALSLGTYYKIKSYRFVKIREETKKLEREFSGGLFQLGNRVGDGVPVEVAFYEVAKTMEGTPAGSFFSIVNYNLTQFGLSLKEALFGERGAIWYYPSSLVESSMKVLLESSRKGAGVVAKSMMSISYYVNNIHQVNERLKDLLSDILSSMKSQISFLTPVIAGIVVGISAMIVTILSRLSSVFLENSVGQDSSGIASLPGLAGLFDIPNIIPSYYLQLIIGLYVIEIAFILTVLANWIENGQDKISERASLSKNLYISGILYFLVAAVITFVFTLLAVSINLNPGGV